MVLMRGPASFKSEVDWRTGGPRWFVVLEWNLVSSRWQEVGWILYKVCRGQKFFFGDSGRVKRYLAVHSKTFDSVPNCRAPFFFQVAKKSFGETKFRDCSMLCMIFFTSWWRCVLMDLNTVLLRGVGRMSCEDGGTALQCHSLCNSLNILRMNTHWRSADTTMETGASENVEGIREKWRD